MGLQSRPPLKGSVDEKMLLEVVHRITNVDGHDRPAVQFQLVNNDPAEVFRVHSIVAAQGRGVKVEHDGLVTAVGIVRAEVVNESGEFPLILHEKLLDHVESPFVFVRLTDHEEVDVPVVIERDTQRSVLPNVCVHAPVHLPESLGVVAKRVDIVFVGGVII